MRVKVARWLTSIHLLPFFIGLVSVTLDLFTTRVALRFGFYESNPFGLGNILWLEYSVHLVFVLMIQVTGKYLAEHLRAKWLEKLGVYLAYAIALLPFIAVINNLNVLA